VSKTVLKNSLRYFDALLEEMREEWRAGTRNQRGPIENKAKFVTVLRKDAQVRLDNLLKEVVANG
jgi:hypothetical protein